MIAMLLKAANCPCCGISYNYIYDTGKRRQNSPSIDRLDSNIGYVVENVHIICYRCNVLKGDGTVKEHQMIVEYMKRG